MKNFRPLLICLALAGFQSAAIAGMQEAEQAYNQGDYKTALSEYQPLAMQGDMRAQFQLGSIYGEGLGVPQNFKESARWTKLSAEQGYTPAQFVLGVMYLNGSGLPKSSKDSMVWLRKAGDHGFAPAQFLIGLSYGSGDGVPKNAVEAAKWYRLAAEQGNANAQFALGRMYGYGVGDEVHQSFIKAYAWISNAIANGRTSKEDKATLSIIEKALTPAQLEEAQALAAEYFAKYQPKSQ